MVNSDLHFRFLGESQQWMGVPVLLELKAIAQKQINGKTNRRLAKFLETTTAQAVLEKWGSMNNKAVAKMIARKSVRVVGPIVTVAFALSDARNGFAGEGREPGGGAWGATVEIGAGLMMADAVDTILKEAGMEWSEFAMECFGIEEGFEEARNYIEEMRGMAELLEEHRDGSYCRRRHQ